MSVKIAKASAARTRITATIKKTIDTVSTLTAAACQSTLVVYNNELEANWLSYYEAFCEHEDAIAGKNDDELADITTEFATIHTSVLKARISLAKLLNSGHNAANNSLNASMNEANNVSDALKTVKMPPCKLTTFSGDWKDWVEFKATCRAMLTERFSDVHRLQQLKDALSGEARGVVAHVLPGDGSYDRAMLLLKKRYENHRAIVNEHLRILYTLAPNDPTGENAATLRHILNTIYGLTTALEGCGIDVSTWDTILIFNTSQCLHVESRKAWEEKLGGQRQIPTLQQYNDFLESRVVILESTQTFTVRENLNQRRDKPNTRPNVPLQNKEKPRIFLTLKTDYQCVICQGNHVASRCDELPKLSFQERKAAVQRNNLCYNCLQAHMVAHCPFNPSCKKCNQNHHTLLHDDRAHVMVVRDTVEIVGVENEIMSNMCSEHFYHINARTVTILATAVVPVRYNGRSILLHALIDQGATMNLISERACQMLQLPRTRTNVTMTGVNNVSLGHGIGRTVGSIGSIHDSNYNLDISALIVNHIADISPLNRDQSSKWSHLQSLQLANPNFFVAQKIDLLLGASAYAEIILNQIVKGNTSEPIAQRTKLGWIVFGSAEIDKDFENLCHALHQKRNDDDDLSEAIRRFWETEETEVKKHLTVEEQAAESIFIKSLKRGGDGKFIVDLPFKVDSQSKCLGESRIQAEKRLRASQRRFQNNPEAKRLYDQNIAEYLQLGHMQELAEGEIPRNFLPHHPVVKESSSTTKVRTVFDASAKTSNGLSLNDILYVGPTIQPELFELLIKWRRFRYAFCGDIEKMYRQIWVNPEHALFQCILWQNPNSEEIKAYKLLTVTFGTASAPFQAIRSVDEVGIRIHENDAELSQTIRNCFYVDDFLGTANDIKAAANLRERITSELAKYGFNLRKWKANDRRILEGVANDEREDIVNFETTFKTLGVAWQPSTDKFIFKPSKPKEIQNWTKRSILSEIAKLFDPLGWLAPCVAKAKMLMQDIWRLADAFDWDTPIPAHIASKWQEIYLQLCLPIPIEIPRWIGLVNDAKCVEIHGFCDASRHAYAAVVYVKTTYNNNQCTVNMLASKTKLSPIKTVSIPRLELCGAVLLIKLMKRCEQALATNGAQCYAWSDSMVTLAWISACPSRWTTYVANRVSTIQKDMPSVHWNHVPTKQNPADIASRGALIHELTTNGLWWHGPTFLEDVSVRPTVPTGIPMGEIPEQRKAVPVYHVSEPVENHVLEYFSHYRRLLRYTVYAMRWRNFVKDRGAIIKAREIMNAERQWIKIIQSEMFSHDIANIRIGKGPHTPALGQLNPFVDEHGVLRMNGRVGNADMSQQKTAIILTAKHPFTTLLIRYTHERVLHGGVQMTLCKLREHFFVIHACAAVKSLIHKCLVCFRYRKRINLKQQMAELPLFRTEQSKPFTFVGCDYAGFFEIKTSMRRNSPLTKGYIALFICLTTKALHLELVCSLSTAEFVMAFENFTARRGIPALLYTDNGTNFIGAEKEIKRLNRQMFEQNNALTRLFSEKHIEFRTIPARASHMGGIWERAVGSVKYHLRRVLKDTKLNARHFDHVLKQIEACLNSRPLWNVSPEIDDTEVLTPSHFFNFQAINTLPRPDVMHIPLNRLDQYQYLYRLYNSFWRVWNKEYLHQLQARVKWHKQEPNTIIGQIVLISEDNLPPSKWALGRITNVYPGQDGLVRAVEVLCGKTTLRRPIHKLALLPTPDNDIVELLEKTQRGENVAATTHQ